MNFQFKKGVCFEKVIGVDQNLEKAYMLMSILQ